MVCGSPAVTFRRSGDKASGPFPEPSRIHLDLLIAILEPKHNKIYPETSGER